MAEEPVEAKAQKPRSGPTRPLVQAIDLTEGTAERLIQALEKSQPIRLIRGSTIVSAILGTTGLALFIVGIEQAAQDLPVVSNAYGSIAVGLLLLALTGLLLRRLGGGDSV